MNMILAAVLAATTVYVSPKGSDSNDGSKQKPVLSAARAVEIVRGVAVDETKTIVFMDGVHYFTNEVRLVAADRDYVFRAEHKGKSRLTGSVKVTGWRTDPADPRFLVADFPFEPTKAAKYAFVANGKLADFAAYPELSGHRTLRYMATQEDVPKNNRTVLEYDPLDLPNGMDFRDIDLKSAFVIIPQEWASTSSYIATNDWEHNVFHLAVKSDMPLGRFNTGYKIVNTRHGMREPGTWMFEATAGRIIYWPRQDETAEKLDAYISRSPSLFAMSGSSGVVFQGLVMDGCAAPPGGGLYAKECLRALVGGRGVVRCSIVDCDLGNTAGSCMTFVKSHYNRLERSRFHHAGSSCASFADGGEGNWVVGCEFDHSGLLGSGHGVGVYSHSHVIGNYVHDIEGAGICAWSGDSEFVSNRIVRTMLVRRDGGGVYGAMVRTIFKDNYCSQSGNWPGLYNDEGGRDTVYTGNVFEGDWWPFHMHDCYNITVTNNTFIHDGGMRLSFQGSTHCKFKDNLIKTALPFKSDPYVDCTDVWSSRVQLKRKDGSYSEPETVTFTKKVLPPQSPAVAVRVTAPLAVEKGAFAGGTFRSRSISAARSREGIATPGVPGTSVRFGFDATNLYVSGTYEYNKLAPYFGVRNFGQVWGVHDAVRFHFDGFNVTVYFSYAKKKGDPLCASVVSSDGSLLFTTNNAFAGTGWWGRSTFGFSMPLSRLGIKGDPSGKEVPFNLEFYNADHDEYKYFSQPDRPGLVAGLFGADGMLSAKLAFREHTVDVSGLVDILEREEDGSSPFPGPIWPDGGVVQSAPAACERPGEGYKDPLHYDSHCRELIGYILAGDARLQAFPMLPFSMQSDPPSEGRFTRRMEDSSRSATTGRFLVRTENWDLGTESTASKNCAYLRFSYPRGGAVRVLLDAQDAAPAHWLKDSRQAKVVAADSSIVDGVFEGSVTAEVDGKKETIWAKIAFAPKPVAVRELAANGRPGKRYVLEFHLPVTVGDIQAKAAISGSSAAEAAERFAADGDKIDFAARAAACRAAWTKFLGTRRFDASGKELRRHYTSLYRERALSNLRDAASRRRVLEKAPPIDSELTLDLESREGFPRNGEGDMIKLRDGGILFVYTEYCGTSRNDHATAHLVRRVSGDGGRTWSDAAEVAPRSGAMNDMSASLLRLRDGRIALFYLRKNSGKDCMPVMRTSGDEGRTWSDETDCLPKERTGYYVLNNSRAERTGKGRILLPLWNAAGTISCVYSDDDGKSWRQSEVYKPKDADGKSFTCQEPGVIELKDGRIYLYARTDRGCQWQAFSRDGGETWEDFGPSPIDGPVSPATIKRLPSGELVLLWNDHEYLPEFPKINNWQRAPMTIAISRDEGKTWTNRRTVLSDLDGFSCYFSMLADGDSLIIHSYDRNPHLTGSGVRIVKLANLLGKQAK